MIAVDVRNITHRYGDRTALDSVSFSVEGGEIFGLLGPNGGGKTTLFRILCTLMTPSDGTVEIFGMDLGRERAAIRRRCGTVFQHPSLDDKLTVAENLMHHGHLYGLSGAALLKRSEDLLGALAIADRARDTVETLSGGLKRRVELAKGLLSKPDLLILDEPSTGLDPGARRDLWQYLDNLQSAEGTTILVTTHLMEEAEACSRLAIINHGSIVSTGSPDVLRSKIGGDIVTIRSADAEQLAARIKERFSADPMLLDGNLRLEMSDGHLFVRSLIDAFGDEIAGISLDKPTLEDVFVHETGHRFWQDAADE